MTQNETEKTTSLSDRQLAALPHLAASSTLSQGARAADACPEPVEGSAARPSTVGSKTIGSATPSTVSSPRPPTSSNLSFRP